MHCITLAKEKGNSRGHVFTLPRAYESCLINLSTLYFKTVDWSSNKTIGKGMLFSVEQAFVGREEIRAPLKGLRVRLN